MGVEEAPKVIRCRNCGKYVMMSRARFRGYCSEACTVQYAQCANCGRFFERPFGGEVIYCSSDCAAVYHIPINRAYLDG